MPERPVALPPPQAFALPFKDALRGLRATAHRSASAFLTEDMTKAGAAALPPLAKEAAAAARLAARTTEAAARRLDPSRVDAPQISGLTAIGETPNPELAFAEAAYRSLAATLARLGREDFLISQTLAAYAYRLAMESAEEASFAARLIRRLFEHHVVAFAPGTPLGLREADRRDIAVAIFALMTFLFAERLGGEPADEVELRNACADVAAALKNDIVAVRGDWDAFAALVQRYVDAI